MRRPKDGKELENMVADAFRDAGYHVTQNLRTSGQEIDIIAEQIDDIQGRRRLAVECKYRTSGLVSNQDVFDWIYTFDAIRQREKFDLGLLITNTGVSPDGKKAADAHYQVRVMTLDELLRVGQDPRRRLSDIVSEYERDDFFNTYVPLGADQLGWRSDRIESDILSWLFDRKFTLISVIGDFGAGKTTLMRRLRYRLAKKALENRAAPIPLLISLKEYGKAGSCEALINMEGERSIGIGGFHQWLVANDAFDDFVLLLDGLDELAPPSGDEHDGLRALVAIWPALASGARCVLTCRPAYFLTAHAYNEALNTLQGSSLGFQKPNPAPRPASFSRAEWAALESQRAERTAIASHVRQVLIAKSAPGVAARPLDPKRSTFVALTGFSEAQINKYLENRAAEFLKKYGMDWIGVRDELYKIYDLKDLMRRPLLLSMIVETVLADKVDLRTLKVALGPFQLYELYTSHKLEIEGEDKGRARLAIDDRRYFAEAIAMSMLATGQLETSHESVLASMEDARAGAEAGSMHEKAARMTVRELAADTRLCGFIVPTDDGRYRFAHRSFMEFFVARSIARRLLDLDTSGLASALPAEVKFFVGSFVEMEPGALNGIKTALMDPDGVVRANAASIAFQAGPVSGLEVRNVTLVRESFKRVQATRGQMIGTRFNGCTVDKATLQDLKIVDVVWDDTELAELDISGCPAAVVRCYNARIKELSARNANLTVAGAGEIGLLATRKCDVTIDGEIVSNELKCSESKVLITALTSQPNAQITDSTTACRDGQLIRAALRGGSLSSSGAIYRECSFSEIELLTEAKASCSTFDRSVLQNATARLDNVMLIACKASRSELDVSGSRLADCQLEHSRLSLRNGVVSRLSASNSRVNLSDTDDADGWLTDSELHLRGSRHAGGTVEGGRVIIDGTSELHKVTLRRCSVSGKGSASDCSLEGEVLWEGCSLRTAKVSRKATVTLASCSCKGIESNGATVVVGVDTDLENLVARESVLRVDGPMARVKSGEIINSRVDVFDGALGEDVTFKHSRVFGAAVVHQELDGIVQGVTTGLFIDAGHTDGFLFDVRTTPSAIAVITGPMNSERICLRLRRRVEREVPENHRPEMFEYIDTRLAKLRTPPPSVRR